MDVNFKERLLLSLSAMWASEMSYSKFGNCSASTSIRKVSAWYESEFPQMGHMALFSRQTIEMELPK